MKVKEFKSLRAQIEAIAPDLSDHRSRELKSILHRAWMKKYGKHSQTKFGTLNVVFTDKELQVLLAHVHSPKFRLLFKYQAYLGLRIGEAVRVNIKDINPETKELTLITEKTRCPDTLKIPEWLYFETKAFIENHKEAIARCGFYLFYRGNDSGGNRVKALHISRDYARNRFNEARRTAGLEYTYGMSDERYPKQTPRRLYRLTTHSLRRHAITRFHSVSRDLVRTSRFARHRSTKETAKYIAFDRAELYRDIDIAFGQQEILQKKSIVLNASLSAMWHK